MDLDDKIEIPGFLLPFIILGFKAFTEGFKPMPIGLACEMQRYNYHDGPWYIEVKDFQEQFPGISIENLKLYKSTSVVPVNATLIAGSGMYGYLYNINNS